MSSKIMYRAEAEQFLNENGWKLFLDKLIKEKFIVMDEPKSIQRQINEAIWGKGKRYCICSLVA